MNFYRSFLESFANATTSRVIDMTDYYVRVLIMEDANVVLAFVNVDGQEKPAIVDRRTTHAFHQVVIKSCIKSYVFIDL